MSPPIDLIAQNRQQAEQISQQAEQISQQAEQNRQLLTRVDELTNVVALLKEENQRLRDEIAFLKGQKPRPKIPPSALEGPKSKDKEKKPGLSRGKHPRRKKKTILEIHKEQVIQPTSIPDGAVFKGYKTYDVQDIVFRANNTRFLIARWQLPDGTYVCGELPQGIQGHYGHDLIAYILNDYYACRVTEPLLLDKLHQCGVLISEGKLNNILINGKATFHQEKDELLAAGVGAHNQIQTDDCGARHKGKNQYTNVIGNEWFTIFTTTNSKSRANFFRLLQGGRQGCLINDDALAYLRGSGASSFLLGYIAQSNGFACATLEEWLAFLTSRNITQEAEVRFVTEAALCASVIENGIPRDLGVHGDDAGQFNAFIRSLCWIHEERHYRKIVSASEKAREDLKRVCGSIWTIYNDLKAYQQSPSDTTKLAIEKQFDDLFLHLITSSATLNKRLRMTYGKKQELLRVLERPDTPLHNNSSETDARAAVTKRKVSGGTRSDIGRDARDTFLSLKQTCRKLDINFISFLRDRIRGAFKIPRLAEIIRQRSTMTQMPP